jgi:hypothetical protein
MSSAINYVQNSLYIPSYSRQQQINIAERQIEQIDRQIANNDEFQKIGGQLLAALEKNQSLRTEHLKTLKESRATGQRIVDKSEQLLACYEKLLEIRRAKNNPETTVAKVSQSIKEVYSTPVHSNQLRDKAVQQTANVPTIQTSNKPVDMGAISADATQKLGDLLFDRYKEVNTTAAMNLRERFFEDLGYDATKKIASVNSNLSKIFDNFATYLKIGEYSYLANNKHYLDDLQTKLMRFDRWC